MGRVTAIQVQVPGSGSGSGTRSKRGNIGTYREHQQKTRLVSKGEEELEKMKGKE
jgi:ribosomal protein L15